MRRQTGDMTNPTQLENAATAFASVSDRVLQLERSVALLRKRDSDEARVMIATGTTALDLREQARYAREAADVLDKVAEYVDRARERGH